MKLYVLILFWLSAALLSGQSVPAVSGTQTTACPTEPGSAPNSAAATCPPADRATTETGPAFNPYATVSGAAAVPSISSQVPPEIAPARTVIVPAPYKAVGPITTQTEFEIFAENEAGRALPIYGRSLFDEAPTTFAPLDQVPVPANYVLGPGDELLIRAWGKIDLDTRVEVDRNGQIFVPRVGSLTVAGLRYEQLEGFLHASIAALYKDFDLNVTMGQLRSIQIFVLGSARQPGAYTVSSLSTLVNALFTSGGPSATGSMRHIQLRRGDRQLTEFDVYDLLRRGDKSRDMQLLPGDVIYIPPAGPQVALVGSVNEPGIYELKGDETVASALEEAAGTANLADENRVLLERIENHANRQVEAFALDAQGLKRVLRDGDLLRVYAVSPRFDNAVTLRGNVAQPGRYVWHEGMRISDLIPSRQFLLTRDYWNQQNFLVQQRAGNPFDLSPNQYNPQTGANAPAEIHAQTESSAQIGTGSQAAAETETTFEAARNAEEINWDYAAIERLDEQDLSTRLIPFNLGNAIDSPTSNDNQQLRAGDVITIFSEKDTPLPVGKHAVFVRIDGEVNAPGVYRVDPGESLRDVVKRAGGITPNAYLYASVFTRLSTRLAEELELKQSTEQLQRELLERNASVSTAGGSASADQTAQLKEQQALLAQLASVRPTGRVVLAIKPSATTVDDVPAFPLEDGDRFYIPTAMNTVQVSGAVYNESAFRYERTKRLSSYLNDAGGPTRQADVRRIFLIRADGAVVSRQTHGEFWRSNFENTSLMPGDSVIVPPKLKGPNAFLQQLPFYTQMLSQAALTGAVLGTTY